MKINLEISDTDKMPADIHADIAHQKQPRRPSVV